MLLSDKGIILSTYFHDRKDGAKKELHTVNFNLRQIIPSIIRFMSNWAL